ncbi:hypothetical protein B0H14DRAFT_2702290 [Mycena olivaceomarginata]|nr:hypothetical protein B0H14DRAFT_2702290 [Mycena olivaceomarginata]
MRRFKRSTRWLRSGPPTILRTSRALRTLHIYLLAFKYLEPWIKFSTILQKLMYEQLFYHFTHSCPGDIEKFASSATSRRRQSREASRPPLSKLPYWSSLQTRCLYHSTSDCHVHSLIVAHSDSSSCKTARNMNKFTRCFSRSWKATPQMSCSKSSDLHGLLGTGNNARGATGLLRTGKADWVPHGKAQRVRDRGDHEPR